MIMSPETCIIGLNTWETDLFWRTGIELDIGFLTLNFRFRRFLVNMF